MCIVTDGSEKPIPDGATQVSFNGVSRVWRGNNGYIYKRSTPFLTNNEYYLLDLLRHSYYVPYSYRYDKYTIMMEDKGKGERVTDKASFIKHMRNIADLLRKHKIRHGDLTRYAIIVKNNKPYIIDFAESRLASDPRPDKRSEGDSYWIEKIIDELTYGM